MWTWDLIVYLAVAFIAGGLLAWWLSKKENRTGVLPGSRHIEFDHINHEETETKIRPWYLIPIPIFLLIIAYLYSDIYPQLIWILLLIAAAITGFIIFNSKTVKTINPVLVTQKLYMDKVVTLTNRITIASPISIIECINKLFYKLRIDCKSGIVVAKFFNILISPIYLRNIEFITRFLKRFREFTIAVLFLPVSNSLYLDESNNALFKKLVTQLITCGAVLIIETERLVGNPRQVQEYLNIHYSKPLSLFAKSILMYDDIKQIINNHFLYICPVCLEIDPDNPNISDAFDKALKTPLASYDKANIIRVLYIPSASNHHLAELARHEADLHIKKVKDLFKNAEAFVFGEFVIESKKSMIFSVIILVADRSPQLDEWMNSNKMR